MRHVVNAKLLLFDAHDQLLLLQRSHTHPHVPHSFDLPGGEVEADECINDALAREVLEALA